MWVSIDFSSKFLINSLSSAGSAPRTPTNADLQNFDKILKKLKNGKISIKIIIKWQVSIDFSTKILITSLETPNNAFIGNFAQIIAKKFEKMANFLSKYCKFFVVF